MNYKKSIIHLQKLYRTLNRVVDIILPPRCPQTGQIVAFPGFLSPTAWKELTFISPPLCACCGMPFSIASEELNQEDALLLCGECLAHPRPFTRARSALTYTQSSKSLILAFKHGDKTHLCISLAALLEQVGQDILQGADFLIPVPLHRYRLLKRRYNQAALLCHTLTKRTSIPTLADALQRIRHTPPQGHKGAKDRHSNVKNAFTIHPRYATNIIGKSLVLIDDVFTTGATLEECCRVLLGAGAKSVNVLTVARVVRTD